jgi:hypothetical protein
MLVQIRQTRSKPCKIAHIVHIVAPITPPETAQTNRIKCQRLEAVAGDHLLKSLRRVRPPAQIRLRILWETPVLLFLTSLMKLLGGLHRRGWVRPNWRMRRWEQGIQQVCVVLSCIWHWSRYRTRRQPKRG